MYPQQVMPVNRQMPWPPVNGLAGPHTAQNGGVFYTDLTTNTQLSIQDVFPRINGLDGPLQNAHNGSVYYKTLNGQPVSHEQAMQGYNQGGGGQPQQPVYQQQNMYPQTQPANGPGQSSWVGPTNSTFNNNGQHGATYANGSSSLYRPTGNTGDGNDTTYGAQRPPPNHREQTASPVTTYTSTVAGDNVSSSGINITAEVVNDLTVVKKREQSLAHTTDSYVILPIRNAQGFLIDTIVNREIKLDKNTHLQPQFENKIEIVSEVVEEVKTGNVPSDLITDYNLDDAILLTTEKLKDAALIARHYYKSGRGDIYKFTVSDEVAIIDSSDVELVSIVDKIIEEEKWVDIYHAHYDLFCEHSPIIVNHIDSNLKRVVNNILKNVMCMSTQIDGTYYEDKDDLFTYLRAEGRLDAFYSNFLSDVSTELTLTLTDFELEGVTTKALTVVYESAMVVGKTESIIALELGIISHKYTPGIHQMAVSLRKATAKAGGGYRFIYVVGTEGGIVKVASSSTTMPEVAIHTAVCKLS